jgi:hypothetical protein
MMTPLGDGNPHAEHPTGPARPLQSPGRRAFLSLTDAARNLSAGRGRVTVRWMRRASSTRQDFGKQSSPGPGPLRGLGLRR